MLFQDRNAHGIHQENYDILILLLKELISHLKSRRARLRAKSLKYRIA